MQNVRTLKVYRKGQTWSDGFKTTYKDVPAILLSGEWLKNNGFNISDKLEVVVDQGLISIRKV